MKNHISFPYMLALWVLIFPLISFLILTDDFRESEYSARVGWLILLTSFAYVFRRKWLYLLLLIPFFISGLVDLFYTSTFQQQFESPLFRVLADTDFHEASEFLNNYLGAFNASIILLYVLGFIYLGTKTKMFRVETFKSKLLISAGLLMLIVAVQQTLFYERFKDVIPGAIGQSIDGYAKYLKLQDEMSMRPQLLANFNGKLSLQSDKPQTYVVVIGESAVRKHHSLFGYQRQTNPLLEKIRDDLILFDDVLSPFAITYLSLSHTLSQQRVGQAKPFTESLSSVGVAKKAGFKTWWISTQASYEGTTLSLSLVADESVYLTDKEKLDAAVIDKIKVALADESKHKVIFVHIRGSHMTYSKRYPESFDYFKDDQGIDIYTQSPSKKQIEITNAYDNSIRFTDSILYQIIDLLDNNSKARSAMAGLVYFSDHGEEVYDYKDFIGHELKRTTPVMFEIPFLVWANTYYKDVFNDKYLSMKQNKGLPFLNDDFFDFGLCFMGIESELANEASSPCENKYLPKQRIVGGKRYINGKLEN